MTAALPLAATAALAELQAAATCAVIDGEVGHRRRRPAQNAFAYRAFCLRLPLAALDRLAAHGIAWNRRGLVSFHDADHGARDGSALEPWIRGLLAREGLAAPGPVILYTFPRVLGYVFNPVSFWVCHDAGGGVAAVLAEVNNTFGETHHYLLAHDDGRPIVSGETLHARKVFHVSPFCEVAGRYQFRFRFGADRWLARIDYFTDDAPEPLLETHVSGRAVPFAGRVGPRLVLARPLFTLGVIARIHWQAAKLWAKRVPWFSKPAPPAQTLTRD